MAKKRGLSQEEIEAIADKAEGKSPDNSGKPKGGRPTVYQDAFADQAAKLCALGATDDQLADFFGVDVRTIYRWKHKHDEFCQALKAGKDDADARVERSLFQKAVGYEQEEVKIFMPGGAAEPVYANFTAKYAPDTTACIFWLKNRRPEEWRDRVQNELTGKDGGPIEFAETAPSEKLKAMLDSIAPAEAE